MKPTELTTPIVAAFSLLGELAGVMRSNNVPLKKEGRVSTSKTSVTEGSTTWDCTRLTQATLMLQHKGKTVNQTTIEEMASEIISADLFAKAGYAIEKATGKRMDAIHKAFKDAEAEVSKGKGADVKKAA